MQSITTNTSLEEIETMMKQYEKTYGITSVDFNKKEYDISKIPIIDKIYWEFYIQCFKEKGGIL